MVLIDQALKWVMVEYREGRAPISVIGDYLQIDVIRNSGAAFGLGGGVTILFSGVALLVAVVVIRQARTMTSTPWAIALGALLGGAIGNLIDRLTREPGFGRGAVVDYVDVQYFSVFNFADAALTLSAVAIAVLAVRGVPMSTPPTDDVDTDSPGEGPVDDGPNGHSPYSGS